MLNIIVVSRNLRAPFTLSLACMRTRCALAGASLCLFGAVAGLGWAANAWLSGGDAALDPLRTQVADTRGAVEAAKADAQRDINAMAARLGELQAQANRLNALGQRLTALGQLKEGEFDFSERPGMGGPETPTNDTPDLAATLGSVESDFARAEQQLDVLTALLQGQQSEADTRPNRMPAPGYISSGFGTRADPFTGGRSHHLGVDIDAQIGDPIKAAANGMVSFSGIKTGYGNVVIVDHGNGYQTLYAHNQRNLVRAGDVVRAGQEIGKVGSSGRSTGSHLHFEVHVNGRPVNPTAYLGRIRG